jgi:hypothetical protein
MGTVTNSLIQLYDCSDKRWITHETDTLLSLKGVDMVLARAKGVTRGSDMAEEVDKLLNHGKSRKRPADGPLLGRTSDISDRSVRPRMVSSDSDSAAVETPKASSTTVARRKFGRITGDLAIRPDPSHSRKVSRPNDTGDSSDSDGEDDDVLFGDRGAPASRKSAWPLKLKVITAEYNAVQCNHKSFSLWWTYCDQSRAYVVSNISPIYEFDV